MLICEILLKNLLAILKNKKMKGKFPGNNSKTNLRLLVFVSDDIQMASSQKLY